MINLAQSPTYHFADPESLEWNRLDDALLKNLDKKRYFCPSREIETSSGNENGLGSEEQPLEKMQTERAADTVSTEDLQVDTDSDDDDTEVPQGSLFDYCVPGVLNLEEVSKLDLAHWKIIVRKHLVDLEVSQACFSMLPMHD